MRRALRIGSTALIVAGLLALAEGAVTLLWQEPFSAFYAGREQGALGDRLAELERTPPPPAERRALAQLPEGKPRLGFAARAAARRIRDGQPVGRIRASAIGLDTVVLEGTGSGDLRRGPGHYPKTPLPGARGTVAVAGHRTTYGAPFHDVDKLDRGDRIEVVMPYGRFAYRVERTQIVPPSATYVTRRVKYDRLVLTACHPLYSAAQRIVVFARLERSEARGAAA